MPYEMARVGFILVGTEPNVVDVWDLALVIAVILLEGLLDDIVLDTTEHFLDGPISNPGVLHCNRTLQNRNALGILIENGVNILCRPKRVLIEIERNPTSARTAKRPDQKVINMPS